jgi:hypothetical protein
VTRKTGSEFEPTDRMVAAGRKAIENTGRVEEQEEQDGIVREVWRKMAIEAQKEREDTTAAILAKLGYQQRRSSDGDCNSWGAVYMGTYGSQGDYSRRRSSVSAVPTASDLAVPTDCRSYWYRSVFVEWRDYEGSYGHEEVHY